MKNQFSKIVTVTVISLLPSFAFAACTTIPGTIQNIVCLVTDVAASYIVPLLTIGAFVFFLWRVFKMIQDSDSGPKRTENRVSVMWSIVGLTVMVAIWGIVAVIGSTLGIDSNFVPQVKPPLTKSGWKGYTTGGTTDSGTTTGQNGSNNTTGQNGSNNTTGQNGSNNTTGQNGSK